MIVTSTLQCRHNGRNNVSNHQPHDCFSNRLFRRISKKTSKPRVTGLCAGNSPHIGEFPAQMASNAENVSIWWRHHEYEQNSGRIGGWKYCIHMSLSFPANISLRFFKHWCIRIHNILLFIYHMGLWFFTGIYRLILGIKHWKSRFCLKYMANGTRNIFD